MDKRGVVQKAIIVLAEQVARDRAAGAFVGGSPDKPAEIGIEWCCGLGQQTPHRKGLDVGMILQLVPHRELSLMISGERESGDGIEADVAGAVSVEQFGSQFAETQPLPDMAFGGAEALGNFIDAGTTIDQCGHGYEFV